MENNNLENKEVNSKSSNLILSILLIFVLVVTCGYFVYTEFSSNNDTNKQKDTNKNVVDKKEVSSEYRMSGNGLEKFDLAFLKLENNGKNAVYSPLSIKYALEMLAEGADGETKAELDAVIGDYVAKKYENSKNMSFANAMFIKDTFKDSVKTTYTDLLKSKYNAEVVYDSFSDATNLNNWVKDKTLGLIDNLFDSVSDKDYYLVNALGIDMEWLHEIQGVSSFDEGYRGLTGWEGGYSVDFLHEKFATGVTSLVNSCYSKLKFNTTDSEEKVTNEDGWTNEDGYQAVHFEAVANKYDIVNTVGKDSMRATVTQAYKDAIADGMYSEMTEADIPKAVDEYIEQIDKHYKHVSSSTDFKFYDDENIKVFSKDLKEYNGIQLEYIGIMPKKATLKNYVSTLDANTLNNTFKNLKEITLDSFEEGYVTRVYGYIPLFKIDNKLNLMGDLKQLGITSVFDDTKANLSNLSTTPSIIVEAGHSANIEFTNLGIKAAAAFQMGGAGDMYFDVYQYDVPTKEIDLTFDNPFLYLIRDKKSGEVWFVGTVYEPNKFTGCGN